MAFQRPQNGGGNRPTLSVKMSVKQGTGYIQGPSFGFWPNDKGGPMARGSLKDNMLAEVLEFLSNAHEAGLPVSLAMFDNTEQKPANSFKKPAFNKPAQQQVRKPNPFKPQQQEEETESNPF